MFGHSLPTSILRTAKIFALLACFGAAGCASIGLNAANKTADRMTTGSIGASKNLLAGIDPSDWQTLLNVISAIDRDELLAGNVSSDWNNPITGSKGHITQVTALPTIMDQDCRSFKSSMHSVTGVENIAGQVCKIPDGEWQIIGFSTDVSV